MELPAQTVQQFISAKTPKSVQLEADFHKTPYPAIQFILTELFIRIFTKDIL